MNDLTVLNLTNVTLGLATLALWSVLLGSVVQEMLERRRRRREPRPGPTLRLVPRPRRSA